MATLAGGIAACASNFEDGELANIPDSHPGFINVGGRIQRIADDEFGDADKGRVQTFLYSNPVPTPYPITRPACPLACLRGAIHQGRGWGRGRGGR